MRLLGVAARELAGKRVQLVFAATGKTVATVTLGPDGRFAAERAAATAQAARVRQGALRRQGRRRELADAEARAQDARSRRSPPDADRVTIAGRVVRPLATRPKDRAITVQRVVACKSVEAVATAQPKPSGAFSVTVRAPAGQSAAVYRLLTKVRTSTRSKALARTFTLPRAVDFR